MEQQSRTEASAQPLLALSWVLVPALAFFALAFGPISFFQLSESSLPLASLRTWQTLALGLLIGFGRFALLPLERRIPALSRLNQALYAPRALREALFSGSSIMLALVLLSDLPWRLHTFLPLALPIWALCLLFGIAVLLFRFGSEKRMRFVLSLVLGACAGTAIGGFLLGTNGDLIFTDDHPAFLYRLIQLKENFPAIPFYNPMWNAGVEAREFFPSGTLNLFFLFSPLIYLFDPREIYNFIVVGLLWIITPAAAFVAARMARLRPAQALAFSILSLISSISWYRWGLAYGTMGFAVSAAFVPLNLVLAAKYLDRSESLSLKTVILTVVSVTLTALWSPSILLLLPVLCFALIRLKTVLSKPYALVTIFLILAVNAPWVAVFYRVSNVGAYVTAAKADGDWAAHDPTKFKPADKEAASLPSYKAALRTLRENTNRLNPLVVCFGITGLFLLKPGTLRSLFSMLGAWAFLLGTFGPLIKPQLELERMYVVFGLVLSLPAGVLVAQGCELPAQLTRRAFLPAIPLMVVLLAPFWLWKVASNRTSENYTVAGSEVRELTQAIREHAKEGRILFAGFILHELNSGHVAPLAAFTGRPLVGSSYQHDSWKYKDVIPEEYRRREERGVEEFLDLMNVSTVIAHDPHWRRWFSSRPKKFKRIWKGGKFVMFERLNFRSDYFLSGSGRVLAQQGNSVVLRADTDDAVAKFRYLPFLEAGDCEVLPYYASTSIKLVQLRGCAQKIVTLRAAGVASRLFPMPHR